MKKRMLGNGLEVSAIGLGCMGMDHAYGAPRNRNEMIELIRKAVDSGCNFFDTAVVYGEANEEVLGTALEVYKREEVIIATKFGIIPEYFVPNSMGRALDSRPKTIRQQLEGSLQRLKVEYIDLYYQHRIDPEVEPEEVARTMKELMDEGKIKHWGLSNAPIEYVRRAHAVCPVTAIENQYSMVYREAEKEVFDVCEELGIGFVAYSPLGNGFLSGMYTKDTTYEEGDYRNNMSRFTPAVMAKNQALLNVIEKIATEKNASNAQVVLAWELAMKAWIVPIPGTTKLHRLVENLASVDIAFSSEELALLNSAIDQLDIDESHF